MSREGLELMKNINEPFFIIVSPIDTETYENFTRLEFQKQHGT